MSETKNVRPLRLSAVATLILLSIQAWTGDFVNVFLTSTFSTAVSSSVGGFFQAVMGNGLFLILHGMEGFLVLLSAIGVLAVSFRYRRRSVKIAAALGLIFILVAGLGGYFFVTSGFSAGGSSMQMGGAFLGSYAMYFLVLYYSK
jgi:heme A synthase